MARWWHGWQYEDGFRLPATTPGGRRGAGDEAALVIAMARLLIAVFVLLGVLTTFARETAAALVLLGSERFEH
jgi:hypothetical protein